MISSHDASRDVGVGALYDAEMLVRNMFDAAARNPGHTVEFFGSTLTLPPEAKFAGVQDVSDYVRRVLTMPVVGAHFPRAALPVAVRRRAGAAAAHYERDTATIAIPTHRESSGTWALRELVVLHELAHHLDETGVPAHGPGFRNTLIELSGMVMGAELSYVLRTVIARS